VYLNGLHKSFAIFLYLKLLAGDKVSDKAPLWDSLHRDLKMNDPKGRTFRKHFQELLDRNWVGYNPLTGIYHIRSFDYLRAHYGFKKRSATELTLHDIKQIQVYLVGVLISAEINAHKYYWEKVKRKPRAATKKRGVANQSTASLSSQSRPPYYGLSNRRIAHHLGCKPTRACVLKKAAAQAGYLTIRHRYKDFKDLAQADYALRPALAQSKPAEAKRLRFWSPTVDGSRGIKVVLQQHDEIIPHLRSRRIRSFSALRVPFGVLKAASGRCRPAA
jgi:hypothetical protein